METNTLPAVKVGAFSSEPRPIDPKVNLDAEIVSKVANVPMHKADLASSTKDLRDAAETAMKDIQHFISSQARSVRISKDETSGHMIVQLVDPGTGEVIRTLPSEELLRLARSFEMLGNKMVHQVA